jgi:hypothetical protein
MRPTFGLLRILTALALLFPLLASARVGEVLFVYGSAHAVLPDGRRIELVKGTALDEGARLVTGATGRLQFRMDDGGLIVLRPLSELVIEQFDYAPAAAAATQTPRSLMSLVRGGFRAITGTFGRTNPEAYEVRTPVATIGIRGTDYSALFCAADCADLELDPGLYVGVTDGAIVLANTAGSMDVHKGGYAFVRDAQTAPVQSRNAGFALALANQAARAAAGFASQPRKGAMNALVARDAAEEAGETTPEVPITDARTGGDLTGGAPGGPAVGYAGPGAESGVTPANASGAAFDAQGRVIAFAGDLGDGAGHIALAGGDVLDAGADRGRDGATGLHWGRWSGGAAVVTTPGGATQTHALGSSSLHYVAAADAATPVLPATGTAQFELIGNTNPTDDAGRIGTLGSASLAADFTARTVDADLKLGFAETATVWTASARDVPMNAGTATFGGGFDSVTVTGAGFERAGSGTLSGFFTGDAQRVLTGAGVSYGLTDGDVAVAGSAAFQVARSGG